MRTNIYNKAINGVSNQDINEIISIINIKDSIKIIRVIHLNRAANIRHSLGLCLVMDFRIQVLSILEIQHHLLRPPHRVHCDLLFHLEVSRIAVILALIPALVICL
jgi:hypothetical protein